MGWTVYINRFQNKKEFLEKEAKEVAAYNEKITAKKEDFDARLSKYLNENFYGGYVTVGTKVFKV